MSDPDQKVLKGLLQAREHTPDTADVVSTAPRQLLTAQKTNILPDLAVTSVLVMCVALAGCSSPTDERALACAELGRQFEEKRVGEREPNRKLETFYSARLEMCVQTDIAVVGLPFYIRDLSRSVLRTGTQNLLHCDHDGADSVILDQVNRYRGDMLNVTYKEWLDDGYGGPPRTVVAPTKPYTRADCERVFQKWITLLQR